MRPPPQSGHARRSTGRRSRVPGGWYDLLMTAIEFVDVARARSARGVRIVVSGLVPTPWSEATKELFRIAQVPVLAVRRMRDASEITAWTGVDNVPVVLHDAEPARTHWAAITALAARLAGPSRRHSVTRSTRRTKSSVTSCPSSSRRIAR